MTRLHSLLFSFTSAQRLNAFNQHVARYGLNDYQGIWTGKSVLVEATVDDHQATIFKTFFAGELFTTPFGGKGYMQLSRFEGQGREVPLLKTPFEWPMGI
jgi:hypothetical protein